MFINFNVYKNINYWTRADTWHRHEAATWDTYTQDQSAWGWELTQFQLSDSLHCEKVGGGSSTESLASTCNTQNEFSVPNLGLFWGLLLYAFGIEPVSGKSVSLSLSPSVK